MVNIGTLQKTSLFTKKVDMKIVLTLIKFHNSRFINDLFKRDKTKWLQITLPCYDDMSRKTIWLSPRK